MFFLEDLFDSIMDSDKEINFSCIQMFFTAFVLCILRLFKLKTEGQTIYRKPH